MTKTELEELIEELEAEIRRLREQIETAPPPEAVVESGRLLAENASLKERLQEAEAESSRLRETLRLRELARQNELLQMQEARRQFEDRKQTELARLREASESLASERALMLEESSAKDLEVEEAQREVRRLLVVKENHEKQLQASLTRIQSAEWAEREALVRCNNLEANLSRAGRQIERMENASPYPRWMLFLQMLGETPGCFVVAVCLTGIIALLIHLVSWIFQ